MENVASYMGAWIETSYRLSVALANHVASYMGAWIETRKKALFEGWLSSHPTWVRGLKQELQAQKTCRRKSHPTWVRGLKHQSIA